MAGGMNAKKIQTWFLVHLVRIAAPKRKQKPWLETRPALTMSRVAPSKKNAKKTIAAEWGAGRSPKTFFSALWVSFWSSSPSPRSATVIEVTLRQDLIKKKKIHHYLSPFSSICFLGDLELLNNKKKKKRKTAVFKLDNKTYLHQRTGRGGWGGCRPPCREKSSIIRAKLMYRSGKDTVRWDTCCSERQLTTDGKRPLSYHSLLHMYWQSRQWTSIKVWGQ